MRWLLLLLWVLAGPALAQDPCPYCRDDPELLAKVGAVSHGPMTLGRTPSAEFVARYPASQWLFLETPHLRLAASLGPEKLSARERKRLEPEFERLRAVLPDFPKKVKELDSHLRLHLLGLRLEGAYAGFQELLGVSEEDFGDERAEPGYPYMGFGRYLGEKDKFELIFHASRATHQRFTKDLMGASVTDALRWHLTPEHKLLASIPAEDADLRKDRWLYSHTVHLLSHLLLCAYKHFSYDPPIWLDEGLAHVLEREVNPASTTLDGDEGAGPHRGGHENWSGLHRKLGKSKKTPSLAEMLRWKAFHDLEVHDHRVAWSKVLFLRTEHPDKLAQFIGALKGQLDDAGYPSGADLTGLQRRLLKDLWSWTPAQFDTAWRTWTQTQ